MNNNHSNGLVFLVGNRITCTLTDRCPEHTSPLQVALMNCEFLWEVRQNIPMPKKRELHPWMLNNVQISLMNKQKGAGSRNRSVGDT